jgi:hypothetical protein
VEEIIALNPRERGCSWLDTVSNSGAVALNLGDTGPVAVGTFAARCSGLGAFLFVGSMPLVSTAFR